MPGLPIKMHRPEVEHFRQAIISNNESLGYPNHLLKQEMRTCGTVTDTMETMKTAKRGKHLNTMKKYLVYTISNERLHMTDKYIDNFEYNSIRETLHQTAHRPQSPI